jgi:phospho-N-acetylmuramoyl-pentapeptide-transferase
MIYLLVKRMQETIDGSTLLGPLGVFRWVEFRAVFSIVISFLIVVLFAKRTIRWLVKQKIGDNPSFDHKDLDRLMKQKANTPTMGGILIAFAILVTTLLLADLNSFYVIMALVCLCYLAAVGFIDDWLKLTTARRKPGSRHGLYSAEKLLLQLGLAVVLGLFIHHWGNNSVLFPDPAEQMMSHSLTLPLMKTWVFQNGSYIPSPHLIVLGTWPFVLMTIFTITYSSNAVNLTDGMDGLSSGTMVIVASAFMVLCFIAGHTVGDFVLAKKLLVPFIPFSDELAIVAGAMVGSCLGFLWFNCSPAQVFMGDTGSLPLGGLLGYIAVVIRQEFLLLVIGGVFLIEVLSVVMQVGYFKLSGGKRIFKCAPIHHHFHLSGWTEQQVVVRFWLISALLTAIALATIKLR